MNYKIEKNTVQETPDHPSLRTENVLGAISELIPG